MDSVLEEAVQRKDNRMIGGEDMVSVDLYLSLGSNQGDRRQNIENAISLLNIELKTPYKVVSTLIETEPWGFDSENKFINAVVLYELKMKRGYNPEAEGLMLLQSCKNVEKMLGRGQEQIYDEQGRRLYKDRPIDVDILLFGDNTIDCEELTVPHKLMFERDFVMIPLNEIKERINNL